MQIQVLSGFHLEGGEASPSPPPPPPPPPKKKRKREGKRNGEREGDGREVGGNIYVGIMIYVTFP